MSIDSGSYKYPSVMVVHIMQSVTNTIWLGYSSIQSTLFTPYSVYFCSDCRACDFKVFFIDYYAILNHY